MVVEDLTPRDEGAAEASTADAPVGGAGAGASPDAQADPAQEVMALLSQHVPLTLLADLASPDGPQSEEIVEEEGLPEIAWWKPEEHTESV